MQSIGRQYYRRADCILFCYDLSTEHPFENVDHWKTQIREYALEEVLVMFIGCKYDLVTNEERLKMHRNKVKEIMQQEEWKEFQPISCECSAKTNHNINGVFIACAELVLKDRKSKPCEIKKVHANNVVLNAQDVKQADPKSRGCCG